MLFRGHICPMGYIITVLQTEALFCLNVNVYIIMTYTLKYILIYIYIYIYIYIFRIHLYLKTYTLCEIVNTKLSEDNW